MARTVYAKELKAGDTIKRYHFGKGKWFFDTVEKIEPCTVLRNVNGFRIYWKEGYDNRKVECCTATNIYYKVS